MADYFKLNIGDWNVGTDNLSLEQEAAYLRVVSAIMLYEQAIPHNLRTLAGLWRCNERKAKRLLAELIDAGKLVIEGGKIHNPRALKEAAEIRAARSAKRAAGRKGGLSRAQSAAEDSDLEGENGPSTSRGLPVDGESTESPRKVDGAFADRKTLKSHEPPGQVLQQEQSRAEQSYSVDTDVSTAATGAAPDPAKHMFDSGVAMLGRSGIAEARAREMLGKWRRDYGAGAVIDALGRAQREGAIDPLGFIQGALRFSREARASRPPEIGETRTRSDGTVVQWAGAIDQWVMVRE